MYGSTRAGPWLCCFVALANPQHPQASSAQEPAGSATTNAPSPSSVYSQREIARAKRLLERGSKDQAIAVLRDVLHQEPENGDAQLLLGSVLALVPERSKALAELQRAVALQPSSALAHFTLGTAQARFGDPDAAMKSFEKTLQLDPRYAEAHVSLAMILAGRTELASARQHLVRAIQIYRNTPPAAHAHYLLAQVLTEQKEPEAALEELDKASSLRPGYAEAFLAQGLIRKQQSNNAAAITAFEKAVALSPSDFDAQYELGAAYLRGGDASRAVAHLRRAAELKPGDWSTLYQLCRALQQDGKAEEAKAYEQQLSARVRVGVAAAANELTATQANNAGVDLEKLGNVAGALEKYRVAVRLNPTQSVFRRNLALALCRLGRWNEGIAELQEVLKENPGDVDATKALYVAVENVRAQKATGNLSGKTQPEAK
jgi:tetratricopeptide (TPR) repeat protein